MDRPWHSLPRESVEEEIGSGGAGLTSNAAAERLARIGPNRLAPPPPPSRWAILVRQFQSPLIYVLIAAAALALALGEAADAAFIVAVLALNALIGFYNEARAEREVRALSQLVRTRARVLRDGHATDIDGEHVVPGDLLLLESGMRISADVRLVESQGLRVDESLLTGESVPVTKDAEAAASPDTPLADRRNMGFAGAVVTSGRGAGLVVATAGRTEVGAIAAALSGIDVQPPPLIVRMRRFAHVIGLAAILLAGLMVGIGLLLGESFTDLLLSAVALAVSAVPEGLPVALTVALAVAVSRMASRGVVVRHLPAVEALGSCGVIATDKTGTLTRNELTVERLVAGDHEYEATGTGYVPNGDVLSGGSPVVLPESPHLFRLLRAGCLANEASLVPRDGSREEWTWSGDPTDVALLSLAIKAGCDPVELQRAYDLRGAIPFEPERRYAATFHAGDHGGLVSAKGAPERIFEMCAGRMDGDSRQVTPFEAPQARAGVERLMELGYRVIALADQEAARALPPGAQPDEPNDLVFLGLVAMTDPPRDGVREAMRQCRQAGIHVVMVTGDHATTAAAIASRVGLADEHAPVLEGRAITEMDDSQLRRAVHDYHIVARATPADKLRIVQAWQAEGAYVAVTGDGVNDAPALRQANLGVAMGRSGTDVAREAAELVITDDNFASIVAGIEEGRVAYDNVRKVVYLLISTGAAEVLMVLSALALGFGVPFTAVQLLWLNLVTNGIQDVALAFERGEPGVLRRPPRPARERIFDRLMIERTLLAGAVMAAIGLARWVSWLAEGNTVEEARNLLVQLFVLFEVMHIGNARSETISLFRLSPMRNPILLAGTATAILVHVAAIYTPGLQGLLGVAPITWDRWIELALWASTIVVVMEIHKALRRRWPVRVSAGDAPSPGQQL